MNAETSIGEILKMKRRKEEGGCPMMHCIDNIKKWTTHPWKENTSLADDRSAVMQVERLTSQQMTPTNVSTVCVRSEMEAPS